MNPDFDWAQLIWLLMALLLVAGGGFGMRRAQHDRRYVLLGVLFWPALVLTIVLAYNAFN